MYAIVQTGSKQYKVAKADEIEVERLDQKVGGIIKLKEVLLANDGKKVRIGRPYLTGATIICEVVDHPRGKKLIAFKYKKRKGSKKKIGHRQELTRLKIKEIRIGKSE